MQERDIGGIYHTPPTHLLLKSYLHQAPEWLLLHSPVGQLKKWLTLPHTAGHLCGSGYRSFCLVNGAERLLFSERPKGLLFSV